MEGVLPWLDRVNKGLLVEASELNFSTPFRICNLHILKGMKCARNAQMPT
jgi:hypothetical protein